MSRKTVSLLCLLLSVAILSGVSSAQSVRPELVSYPNLIFYNAQILTADDDNTIVTAVAIRDGKFLALGSDNDILQLAGPDTQKIDLKGQSVVPGFIDNHGHGSWVGNQSKRGQQGSAYFKTKESGLEEIKQLMEAVPPGQWVTLRTPRTQQFFSVTREDLDPITPNNPVALITSGTDTTVNTRMLEEAGLLEPRYKGMLGLVTDESGEPTGQLFGWAAGVVLYDTPPWPSVAELIPRQIEEFKKMNAMGFTTVSGRGQGLTMSVLREIWLRGEMTVRARLALEFLRLNPNGEIMLKRVGNFSGLGDEWLKITGTSVNPVDGASDAVLSATPKREEVGVRDQAPGVSGGTFAVFGQNKWLGHGYAGTPHEWDDVPLEIKEQTEWQNIQLAAEYGWNITSIHSTGDESTRITLKAYEEAAERYPLQGRWGVDHQVIQTPETIALMKKLNVYPSVNTYGFPEGNVRRYGADMAAGFSPMRTLIDEGIKPAGESQHLPALQQIQYYVTRESKDNGQVMGTHEKIDRLEALNVYTRWGAYRNDEEDLLGTIEAGKLADLVVLGGDFLGVSEGRLCEDLPVMMTVVGGKIVFQTDKRNPLCGNRRDF